MDKPDFFAMNMPTFLRRWTPDPTQPTLDRTGAAGEPPFDLFATPPLRAVLLHAAAACHHTLRAGHARGTHGAA